MIEKFTTEIIDKASWVTDQKSWKYMHWFSDALQRIELLDNYLEEYPIIISNNYLNYPYTKNTLDLMNIPYIVLDREKTYLVKELLFSSHVAPAGNYNEEIINSVSNKIKKTSVKKNSKPIRKIWISREKAPMRNVTNIKEVEEVLKEYKYEKIYLEDMSTEKQIQIINEAKVVSGLQGAGLNNILFMDKNTNILEVRDRNDNHNNCYFSLASALNINFYYAFADTVEPGNFHSSDYTIDINSLKNAFDELEENLK